MLVLLRDRRTAYHHRGGQAETVGPFRAWRANTRP